MDLDAFTTANEDYYYESYERHHEDSQARYLEQEMEILTDARMGNVWQTTGNRFDVRVYMLSFIY